MSNIPLLSLLTKFYVKSETKTDEDVGKIENMEIHEKTQNHHLDNQKHYVLKSKHSLPMKRMGQTNPEFIPINTEEAKNNNINEFFEEEIKGQYKLMYDKYEEDFENLKNPKHNKKVNFKNREIKKNRMDQLRYM